MVPTMLLDRIVNKREDAQTIEVHPRLVERRPWRMVRLSITAAG